MNVFTERRLRFSFDDNWRVVKYDEHPDYKNGIERLKALRRAETTEEQGSQDTCAVDFVGIHHATLLFIEVKDFRGHRIETRERIGKPLAREVAFKVRDTIAGIVGAHRTSRTPETWRPLANSLIDCRKVIKVLLWLQEDNTSLHPAARRRHLVRQSVLTQELKKCLRWLTQYALVVNLDSYRGMFPDVVVTNVPDARG